MIKFLATLFILKRLSLLTDYNFPVVFSPKISVLDEKSLSIEYREALLKAVQFAVSVDKKFPSLYSRLELGLNWDDVFKLYNKFLH